MEKKTVLEMAEIISKRLADSSAAIKEKKTKIKQIARKIRALDSGKEKENCFVCGKFKHIAHYHHILEVAETAEFCHELNIPHENIFMPGVWLCPNHHAIYHNLGNLDVYKMLSQDELDKYKVLVSIGVNHNLPKQYSKLRGY